MIQRPTKKYGFQFGIHYDISTLRPKVLAGAVFAAATVSERVAQFSLYWDLSYTLNGHNKTCTASWDRNMSFIIWIISRRTQTKTVVKAGNRELIKYLIRVFRAYVISRW